MQIIKANSGILEKRSIWGLDGAEGGGFGASPIITANDSSIITLVAGVNISKNELVGLSAGLAILSDYNSVPCVGVALDTVTANNVLRVKISGIMDVSNNTADEYYLGSIGSVRVFGYESGKYLQKIADKVSDNQILLNISDFILMV